jgi:hypothetical protein
MRSITVDVPDRDQAEQAVRYFASQLRDGLDAAVLPIPPGMTPETVAPVIAEAVAKLQIAAAIKAVRN